MESLEVPEAAKRIRKAAPEGGAWRRQLEAMRERFAGEVITRGEEGYDERRLVWNGMIDRYPAAVARPANTADVAAAVNFAREQGLLLAVRGGGHQVAGYGTCDDGLVIDLSLMNQVEVDPGRRIAVVGGGARLGDLDAATQAYGLVVPSGVVSDTGVAGLVLGGGYGWVRDKWGLACDNLVAAEVVTASGEVVRASEEENADLLWGLRGGGGNFGVATRLEMQAYPLGPEVMFAFVFHDGEQTKEVLQAFREFCASAPEEVSLIAATGIVPPGAEAYPEAIHGKPFVLTGAMYAGDPHEGERILQPLREFSTPLADFSGIMPYLQAQRVFDEDYPAHKMRYYWKSLNLMRLDDEALDVFIEHARRQPSPYSTVDLWPVRGAVRRGRAEDGAFFGRHTAFLVNPEANWVEAADDAANIAWVREMVAAMAPFSDGSRYLNFAGFMEEGEALLRPAFGAQYQRLAKLKRKWDPENLFRLNQNVSPDGG